MASGSVAKQQYAEGYRSKFMALFPKLVEDVTSNGGLHLRNQQDVKDAMEHLKNVLEYNVPKGKCNRGLMVIGSLRHLVKDISPELERQALTLGWCIEWLQAFFLVADDIMDQSKTRRGQPCWYSKPEVGLMAINDSFIMEGTLYLMLKHYFKSEPYYIHIVELFHEITYTTEVGQCLDMQTSPTDGQPDLETFTIERYNTIVKYKTAFYSFYLPVALAMYMAGIVNTQAHEAAKKVLLPMGEYFQIQDDYIDCYGDPAVTGKIGTDIEECKCGWLVVQALQRVSPEQMEILKANYGRDNPECVSRVKELYNQLNLKQVYLEYEEKSYQTLMELLDQVIPGSGLPKELFVEFADRIYKRKK